MVGGVVVKIVLSFLFVVSIFLFGIVIGNTYNISDFLCPTKAEVHVVQEDLIGDNGIVIPKGTVINLHQCSYMQRFTYRFAIDNAIKLEPSTSNENSGFTTLQQKHP